LLGTPTKSIKREEPSLHTFPSSLVGLLTGLTLGWGLNWPMIKIVLSEMQPMHFRALCLLFGAVGLLAIARLKGLPVRVPEGQWPRMAVIAIFNMTLWNVLAVYGVRLMASGRASILGYTMPAWSVLLSRFFLGEPFTGRRAAGVALGLMGMGLLLGSEIQAVGRSPLGCLLMVGAALSWALGTIMIKLWPVDLSAVAFAGWQMAIGVVPILGIALFWERGTFDFLSFSPGPIFGIFYNLLVGYLFCYWAWMKIAVIAPVGISSLSVMMIPVVGVFSGILLLGEGPHWQDFVALIAVVGSLATVMLPPRKTQSRQTEGS